MSWFKSTSSNKLEVRPMPEDEGITRYRLTDAGLDALVQGKLSCTKISDGRVKASGTFLVEYDSIVYNPAARRFSFVWKGTEIMDIEFPILTDGNTLTINGLQGRIELSIGT